MISFTELAIDDSMYTGASSVIWTHAEQSIGIVCACLPCLGPLIGHSLGVGRSKHTFEVIPSSETSKSSGQGDLKKSISRQSEDNCFPDSGIDNTLKLEEGLPAKSGVMTNITQGDRLDSTRTVF